MCTLYLRCSRQCYSRWSGALCGSMRDIIHVCRVSEGHVNTPLAVNMLNRTKVLTFLGQLENESTLDLEMSFWSV